MQTLSPKQSPLIDVSKREPRAQPGTQMAAADTFFMTVSGRGGHGAMPHLTTDPVVAAASVIAALQPLVSRETSPTDGAVVTVATISSGDRLPQALSGALPATTCSLLCNYPWLICLCGRHTGSQLSVTAFCRRAAYFIVRTRLVIHARAA